MARNLSEMNINGYQVNAKIVDPSDESKAYNCFTDSKCGADWLDSHVFIFQSSACKL